MKTFLKISLLLNLGLAGALIFLWADGRMAASESMPPVLSAQQPVTIEAPAPMPAAAPRVEPTPLNWSQLASADYRTYVKNLRRIGCPEPTLRAIITADVDAVYRQRSDELEKKLDDLNNGSWAAQLSTYHDQQVLKDAMQRLPAQESADINDFMGLKPAVTETLQPMASASLPSSSANLQSGNQSQANAAANNAVSQPDASGAGLVSNAATVDALGQAASVSAPLGDYQLPPTPKSASLPLVFQPVDQVALNLNGSQQQAVNNLRQDFINSVGGSSQNPTDPAYQQTWQQAQSQSDAMTEVQVGYNAYMQYWLVQYQNSLANQVRPSQ